MYSINMWNPINVPQHQVLWTSGTSTMPTLRKAPNSECNSQNESRTDENMSVVECFMKTLCWWYYCLVLPTPNGRFSHLKQVSHTRHGVCLWDFAFPVCSSSLWDTMEDIMETDAIKTTLRTQYTALRRSLIHCRSETWMCFHEVQCMEKESHHYIKINQSY